jgi:hypothetical protein
MTPEQLADLKDDATLRKRLAKLIARDCFRNTVLEDFHSGKVPSSRTGDYSDVKAITPYGEIEWDKLSRLSDAEMKRLMIDVVWITVTTSSWSCAAHADRRSWKNSRSGTRFPTGMNPCSRLSDAFEGGSARKRS